MNSLRGYRFTKPINVKTYKEGGFYFAENAKLLIHGTGETHKSAIDDFNSIVVHFYEYYKKIDVDRLTGGAIKLKERYAGLLTTKGDGHLSTIWISGANHG
jgi:hypothetical protein